MALARPGHELLAHPAPHPRWRLAAKIVLGVVALGALVAAARFVPVRKLLEAFQGWSAAAGPHAGLLYGLLYFAAALLCVPAAAFSLGAGFLFGFPAGFVISILSIAASAAGAYAIGRSIARKRVKRMLAARPRLAAVDGALREKGWKVVGLLRLNPMLPAGPLNYLLSATSIKFLPFLAGTVIGMLPDTLVYVALGSAGHLLLEPGARRSPAHWALLGLGIAATAVATVLITRTAKRKLAEAEKAGAGGAR